MAYKEVEKRSVVRNVMEQVKALIASGELKTGDKLPTETELAAMFKIGRTSVREAIKVFQHLGILESSPKTGTFVCHYSNISTEALTWSFLLGKTEIFELITLREIIEQRSLEELVARIKIAPFTVKEDLNNLEKTFNKMQYAYENQLLEDQIAADYEFHRIIINSTGNQVFISIYQTLESFMREEISKTSANEEARISSVQEHKKLLSAIESGDVDQVIKTYRIHLETTRKQLSHSLGSG